MLQQLKNFSIYSCFGAATALVGLLTVPYLTRALTPEEYGVIGIFMSVLFFAVPALSVSSEGLIAINKVDLEKSAYQDFANQYISLLLISFLLLSACCFLVKDYFNAFTVALIGLPVIALIQALYRLHSSELVQEHRSSLFGTYNLLLAILLLVLTYLCISVLDLDWEGRIIALAAAEIFILLIRYQYSFLSLAKLKLKITKAFLIEILKYGIPLMLLLVAAWVFNEADRFIILNFLTMSDVGIYVAAYSLGKAVNVINNAMTNSISPVIYKLLKEGKGKRSLNKISLYYSFFILVTSIIAAILFYFFGGIILGAEFESGVMVTCIVLVAFGFNGMYRTVGLPLDYLKKNTLKTTNFSITAVFNLVISIALIDQFGLFAPAIGTLFSFALLYLLTLYFSLKHTKFLAD